MIVTLPEQRIITSNSTHRWRKRRGLLPEPRIVSMLFLGFGSGLPYYLVYSTLSAWLRQEHIVRSTIGMLAWVGLVFSFQFLWAPVVDRVPLPLLQAAAGTPAQLDVRGAVGIVAALLNLSVAHPAVNLTQVAVGALLLAFCAWPPRTSP
jgi:PAT family beta-lactamase induction signal transducer AmpG